MDGPLHILHVDDDPDFLSLTADLLEREDDRFEVETATDVESGLEHLRADDLDCIVSDYEMPGTDGLEFLQTVREDHPELPFVLFTGKGSEEVASRAISAGATDYLQKEGGTSQYTVLANRVLNAISQYRAEMQSRERKRKLEEQRQLYRTVVEQDPGGVMIVQEKEIRFVNPKMAELADRPESELVGRPFYEIMAPEYRDVVEQRYEQRVRGENPPQRYDVEIVSADDERLAIDLRVSEIRYRGEPATLATFHDITERKRREERLVALHETAQTLIDATDEAAVADRAVEAARDVLDQPVNGLWLYDEGADVLSPAAITEEATELFGDQPTYDGGESLSWKHFRTGEVEVFEDVREADVRFDDDTPIRSEIVLPLDDYGLMNIGSTEVASFDDADVSLARILAQLVTAALERAARDRPGDGEGSADRGGPDRGNGPDDRDGPPDV